MKPAHLLILGVIVAVLAIVGSPRGHAPHGGDGVGWSNRLTTPAGAAPTRTGNVSGLRGRPRQRDVDPNLPGVRRYRRSHRLAGRLPLTAEGVTFDAVGRSSDQRLLIAANRAGRTAREIRRIYRRLLRATDDRGAAYRLVIDRPKDLP